jgi:hypothetical protein
MKGTSFITRESKYRMRQTLPHELKSLDDMGALSIIQHPDKYTVYQVSDLDLDFTSQVKRSDAFISASLKQLSRKSYMVVAASNSLGRFQETNVFDKSVKVTKRGTIIRSGDIIRIGRVPIMVKESTIDASRFTRIQESQSPAKQLMQECYNLGS